MKFYRLLCVNMVLWLPTLSHGQISPPAGAYEKVITSSGEAFFYETFQLTHAVLDDLTGFSNFTISVFGFANDSNSHLPVSGECKTYTGDPDWPAINAWDDLNLVLGGALIKTKPVASSCYHGWGDYNETHCEWLTANWVNDSYFQTDDPTSILAELYQNATCLPPVIWPYDHDCTLGSYPPYSVNVTTVSQIQLAINFARNTNLRLVVKNTGHDFGAKSTGAGGLNIWTHHLKDYKFYENYTSESYNGSAVKLGAGVQAYEMYAACHEHNVTCIGGEGRTVGVMGGYIQGGGHSPLSSIYGMAADQVSHLRFSTPPSGIAVIQALHIAPPTLLSSCPLADDAKALEFNIVTPDGLFVTANSTQNTDLFWALRGGGGSTFGVVTSVTVKTYPKMPAAFATFTTSNVGNVSKTTFFAAIEEYWNGIPAWTAAGTYSYFFLMPLGSGLYEFYMEAWFAPNMTAAQLEALIGPLFAGWSALGVIVTPTYQEYDNFYEAWDAAFPLEGWGAINGRQSSRLFPRSNWQNSSIQAESFAAVQSTVEAGLWVFGFHMAPGQANYPDDAVNPAWRNALAHVMMMTLWDQTEWANETGLAQAKAASDELTFVWTAKWRHLTPGSGAYLSESDYIEPDFQHSFWGDNYERLYAIKKQYDPMGLFYAQNAVGSEDWILDEYILDNLPSQAGRLCRV